MTVLLERDRALLETTADVKEAIAALVWPDRTDSDRLGIEAESFVVAVRDGAPAGRLPLADGNPSVLGLVDAAARSGTSIRPRRSSVFQFETAAGGLITFEPGAQIEHSTAPSEGTGGLDAEFEDVWEDLRWALDQVGARAVSLGIDPWHTSDSVPQQLPFPRYRAMDRFFASRWPSGAVMMRNTCAIQVNVDAGSGTVCEERWQASNLMAPLLTAMFACSPAPGFKSRRARVWQELDETRAGLPHWRSAEDASPTGDVVRRVLSSNVMFIMRDDEAEPGIPGWTFREWVEEGHPEAGRPRRTDLEIHLTTLFPEVRPRNGVLELRSPDGIPRRWWPVPAVVAGSLLYDDQSRSTLLELLEPLAGRLQSAWERAARDGLSDPELGDLARSMAALASVAARRQPQRFGEEAVNVTEAYLERFTLRGLSPADELAPLLADPQKALGWAAGGAS